MQLNPSDNLFALIDCNSFFCSCEIAFNPKLKGKPVVVLSNNDGCIVSLTPAARAVGIQMGAPYFKMKELIDRNRVHVFSSNFELYWDMSARVMQILYDFAPEMEMYSIDEAFLNLKGITENLEDYAHKIRKTIYQVTGIPVSVGIAPTKVLAKLANRIAKLSKSGVYSFAQRSEKDTDAVLSTLPVEDIWGVGRKSAIRLSSLGIRTVLEFKNAPEKMIRKELTVTGYRIQEELHGRTSHSSKWIDPPQKQLLSSRSFGSPQTSLEVIQESIASHATKIGEKLRENGQVCLALSVFLYTNYHKDVPQYSNSITITLPNGLDETNLLITYAKSGMEQIYRSGFEFKKCGVIAYDLRPKDQNQLNLFNKKNETYEPLIAEMDRINKKFGSDTVKFAACGVDGKWKMKSESRSRSYTTRWDELLEVS